MKKSLLFCFLLVTNLFFNYNAYAFTGKGVKLLKELIEISPGIHGGFEDTLLPEPMGLAQTKSYAHNTTAKVNALVHLLGGHRVYIINQTNQDIEVQYQYLLTCDGHITRNVKWFNLSSGGYLSDNAVSFMDIYGTRRAKLPINVYTQLFTDGGVTDMATGYFNIV